MSITFAFATMMLFAVIAVAVDYGNAHRIKTSYQKPADAAALAVVRAGTDDPSLSIGAMQRLGKDFFMAQLKSQGLRDQIQKVSVSASRANGSVRAEVDYTGESKNHFGAFISKAATSVGGNAVAEIGLPSFNIFFALDISDSMGMGASTADQKVLYDNIGCVFACHHARPEDTEETTLETARRLGIPLRIDVLKTETQNLLDTMDSEIPDGSLNVAVYSFHDKSRLVQPLTTNFTDAKARIEELKIADGIPRPEIYGAQYGDTTPYDLPDVIKDEVSKANGRNVIVLVTDGVMGTRWPSNHGLFDTSICDKIRDTGVEIAVIYIRYNYWDKENEVWYQSTVANFENDIEPNLRSCASSGMFFTGDQPDEIKAAMTEFWSTLKGSRLRLTN